MRKLSVSTDKACSEVPEQKGDSMASTYRVVINLIEVYTDGSEETISSALVAEEEREDRAQEKMQELLTHAEQY